MLLIAMLEVIGHIIRDICVVAVGVFVGNVLFDKYQTWQFEREVNPFMNDDDDLIEEDDNEPSA